MEEYKHIPAPTFLAAASFSIGCLSGLHQKWLAPGKPHLCEPELVQIIACD